MSVLTQVGHIGIGVNGKNFKLVPSLANMSKLEDPVADYAALHESPDRIEIAYKVIEACCDNTEISEHLGETFMPAVKVGDSFIPARAYSHSVLPDAKVLIIALSLLHHGLIGDHKPSKFRKKDGSEYTDKFDPMAYATAATVHLGASPEVAWGMTMTQIRHAMDYKFPPDAKQSNYEQLDAEYDDLMEWRKSIYGDQGVKPE